MAASSGALDNLFVGIDPAGGAARIERLAWFAQLGASFDFRMDGLGRLMELLVTGVGSAVVLYASVYLKGHPLLGRFSLFPAFHGLDVGPCPH